MFNKEKEVSDNTEKKLNLKGLKGTKEPKQPKEKGAKSVSFEFDKKKLLILILAAVLILGGFYGFKFFKSYMDKKSKAASEIVEDDGLPEILKTAVDYKGHWSEVYMTEIVKRKILRETGVNTLSPDDKIIRAQYMVALYTMDDKRVPIKEDSIIYFEDVIDNFFYTDAINWGSSNGFISGVSDTKFKPNDMLTKEQAVRILFNYYNACHDDKNDYSLVELPYEDADQIASYADTAMKWAYINKLFVYNDTERINPKEEFTRGEVAALLYCYIYDIYDMTSYNPDIIYENYMKELEEQHKAEEEQRKLEEEQKMLEEAENEENLDDTGEEIEGNENEEAVEGVKNE